MGVLPYKTNGTDQRWESYHIKQMEPIKVGNPTERKRIKGCVDNAQSFLMKGNSYERIEFLHT